jgi:hypothetical protein
MRDITLTAEVVGAHQGCCTSIALLLLLKEAVGQLKPLALIPGFDTLVHFLLMVLIIEQVGLSLEATVRHRDGSEG